MWQQESYLPIHATSIEDSLQTTSSFFSFLNTTPSSSNITQQSPNLLGSALPIVSSPSYVSGHVSEAWYQAAGILMSLKHAPINRPTHFGNPLLEPQFWSDRSNEILQRNTYPAFILPTKAFPPAYSSQLPFEPGRDFIGSEVELNANQEENLEPKILAASDLEKTTDVPDPNKDKNKCHVCSKIYARPSTLKMHMRIHNGEKPYQCNICLKAFSQDANLTAHLRVHSGEKPFQCSVCDRRFAQSSSVTTHMRTHTGQRPHVCKHCSKGFADSSTLTKHIRTHTGEKPYECRLCHMRFSQSGNLNRHMRMHTKKTL